MKTSVALSLRTYAPLLALAIFFAGFGMRATAQQESIIRVNGALGSAFNFTNTASVEITMVAPGAHDTMHFTLDGSTPSDASAIYLAPFDLATNATARVFIRRSWILIYSNPVSITFHTKPVIHTPVTGFGVVKRTPLQPGYEPGQTVVLRAEPRPFEEFVRWDDGVEQIERSVTVTEQDQTFRAEFRSLQPMEERMMTDWIAPVARNPMAVIASADGGAVLAERPDAASLTGYDARGKVAWSLFLGNGGNVRKIFPTPDGGLVVAGTASAHRQGLVTAAARGAQDFWVIRLDANRQPLWDRTFGGADDDIMADAAATEDGGYVLAGHSRSGASGNKTSPRAKNTDGWVVKINSAGDLVWQATLAVRDDNTPVAITHHRDGGWLVVGETMPQPRAVLAARISDSGDVLWQKSVAGDGNGGGVAMVADVVQGKEDRYLVAGQWYAPPTYHTWILELGKDGDPVGSLRMGEGRVNTPRAIIPSALGTAWFVVGEWWSETNLRNFVLPQILGLDADARPSSWHFRPATLDEYRHGYVGITPGPDHGYFLINTHYARGALTKMRLAPATRGSAQIYVDSEPMDYFTATNTPVTVTMSVADSTRPIHFTKDGSKPTAASPIYTSPMVISNRMNLRTVVFDGAGQALEGPPTFLDMHLTHRLFIAPVNGSVGTVTFNYAAFPSSQYDTGVQIPDGTRFYLTATPTEGCRFLRWDGSITGTNDYPEIYMDGPKHIIPVFGVPVGLQTSVGGTVRRIPDVPYHETTSTALFLARPDPGHYFSAWSSHPSAGIANPLWVAANVKGINVAAAFTPLPVGKESLTIAVNGTGTVASSGPASRLFTRGETTLLTATGSPSNPFLHWSGDVFSTDSTLSLTMDRSYFIIANFANGASLETIQSPRLAEPRMANSNTLSLKIKNATPGATFVLESSADLVQWDAAGQIQDQGPAHEHLIPISQNSLGIYFRLRAQ